ncbi:Pyridoxal 5'-phosphate synthase subunit PdxT [Austwickia sp. TVS 96-490-7B]|uniref:pyridoxal 5'-phosphate synthase glutaminase subunit PdxT n=1 Tax=Austwickia sp. TVS 96-490-7B TaxID=2830843 RepID=UPI001C57B629|nr:pyridoxal 5'-phosphate synthase glutaminase subunit PdxT [Austwickia sp. TVS 96-490-7B]MBW3086308.1 Pyridoxal 5'-phosphate synthase subunit PdxT [Austwickia sp. TVS 96-490-7B]
MCPLVSTPLIGVLAVQGDVREHAHALERVGARTCAVRRPEELTAVDALVIPGGESTVMDKLVRAFGLQEPLRERLRDGLPAYGSCAGMIMLADRIADARPDQETLGGLDVTVRRNAFGRQVDSFETDLQVEGIVEPERPLRAVFIRAPWVESVGPQAQALATVEHGPAAGRVVAVRQGSLIATSFHPEMGGDDRVHAAFVQMVRSA